MLSRRSLFVLSLLAAALLIRLGLVVLLRDLDQGPTPGWLFDDVEFEALARSLADGKGFSRPNGTPTAFRAPGWPIVLAGVYRLAGTRPWVVYLFGGVLGAAACGLAYAVGRELLDETRARLAGLLAAFYLGHIWFATIYLSENLFAFLLVLTTWLLIRRLKNGSWKLAALGGLLLGGMILTRPFALLLVPLWVIVFLVAEGRRGVFSAGLLVVGTIVVVAPWTLRNYSVYHRLVLVTTNGGSTFYGSNNDEVLRQWRLWGGWVSTVELPHRDLIEAAPDAVSHDQVEWDLGKRWVRDHPGQLLLIEGLKLVRLVFGAPDFDGSVRFSYLLRLLCYLPLLPFLVWGVVRCVREPSQPPATPSSWWIVHGAVLATVLTALIFWGAPRFRDANAPLLMLYVAAGLRRASRSGDPKEETSLVRPETSSVLAGSLP